MVRRGDGTQVGGEQPADMYLQLYAFLQNREYLLSDSTYIPPALEQYIDRQATCSH